ncbi:MAG: phytanoyl-CoA dioxygenase family protein [Pirellulales bacterium]
MTSNCDWFEDGYSIPSYNHIFDYSILLEQITREVRNRLTKLFPDRDFEKFTLSEYHKFITTAEHKTVADRVMKRLYCKDLEEASGSFVKLISDLLGIPVGFKKQGSDFEHWIIVRINPPNSLAYNPIHKDIYEDFDTSGYCPRMINAWVPIAGVDTNAGLGIAAGSHLICESKVLRTRAGSTINGQNYSVNCIQSWDNSSSLKTVAPPPGRMLLFSSHLVHGFGINKNPDTTRVALEFRLHSQEK